MADLSLLIGREAGRFTADTRFDGIDPGAAVLVDMPIAVAMLDPVAAAHAAGFAEGVAAARAEALGMAQADRECRDRLGFSFARLDAELAETLRQRLLATVVALCEQAMAPLALDMPALVRRVERAAAMFMRADDERVIRLHPDDLDVMRGLLPPEWVFLPDPALERGALRVECRSGGVEDGPAQWRQAIAEALERC